MTSSPVQLLVATADNTACFRVTGKPSLEVSNHLRRSAERLLDAGTLRFSVDLAACPSADSTFIGVLLFLAKGARLAAPAEGQVCLWNSCDLVRRQLDSLGVLDRFGFASCGANGLDFHVVEGAAPDKAGTTKVCLEAHKNLIQANAANAAKFKDVVKFLEEDLRQTEPPSPC